MFGIIKPYLSRWKSSPRKWEFTYVWTGLRRILFAIFEGFRLRKARQELDRTRKELLTPDIEAEYVGIRLDPEFKSSVAQVKGFTCLEIARLANLWNLARLAGPGIFLEVGTFRGGTALHLCNAIRHRNAAFYCFDPFEKAGFESMSDLDKCFKPDNFTQTQFESVVKMLSSHPNARAVQGFFPAAAEGLDLRDIAFCHLDVDIYDATKRSLEYLAPRLAPGGLIILDDFHHLQTPGVNKAVAEFLASIWFH
jgi:predicted O-methyltransferase YrrM